MAPEAVFNLVIEFFSRVHEFCQAFVSTGGEINLILNGYIDAGTIIASNSENDPRSKVFQLSLYPEFFSLLTLPLCS